MAKPNPPEVFICFRGEDVRTGFLSFLVGALKRNSVPHFVDYKEVRGKTTDIFFQRIKECRLVLVLFSQNFMDSEWCTNEVLTALETRGPGKTIIPIFYKVSVEEVKKNWSVFLKEKKKDKWSIIETKFSVTKYLGLVDRHVAVDDEKFVKKIVKEVQRTLTSLKTEEIEQKGLKGEGKKQEEITTTTTTTTLPFFGIVNRRVQQLKEKLRIDRDEETRVVGVVGIKGIGKTKLAEMLLKEMIGEYLTPVFFNKQIRKNIENRKKLDLLLMFFLEEIFKKMNVTIRITDKTTHEDVKDKLLETVLLIVLDDLSSKEEIAHLLGDRTWIKQGSKLVILTSDKSMVEGLVDDIYVVPGLNDKEGLECFSHHAFGDATSSASEDGKYLTLSRKFVDYARGNPKALTLLGKELWRRDIDKWESILRTLEKSPNKNIQDLLNSCYNSLTELHQDAFLDITCFFRSHDHKFIKTMVDSSCVANDRSILKDLADKFLIEISGGRVEINGLLYTLGKILASQDHNRRLWNTQEIIDSLEKRLGSFEGVRGIFLDISDVTKKRPLRSEAFVDMKNLRYLKIYNSCFLESDSKLTIRSGLKFSLEEVRYLHWLSFPLMELPRDLEPKNLIDLKLPYSQIKRLWDGHKDTANLKWVDLSHSVNFEDLSGLSGAQNLERLNLEGCTNLTDLLKEIMQTMTSLVYLNLKSCTGLVSFPEIDIKSLKTLILSDCSSLRNFTMSSETLEAVYLDGTALKSLPENTGNMKKLVILNLKGCKMLESLPTSLGNLQALQEMILSGCSKLLSFPGDIKEMKRLRILLLDGTAISQVPQVSPSGMNSFSLLRRLSLSGNRVIETLQAHIGQLNHLKFLDLKDCKNLTSIPMLPPNLERLDAHGCDALTTIASPLAFLNLTDQIHSTFIFSNCKNLYETAKSCIISYIHKKSQLMSSALNRYNLGSVMVPYTGACFPGCEVPEWFNHQAYGSEIEIDLARHQSENQIIGVVLCAAVSFQDHRDQISGFFVKCNWEFKNATGSLVKRFSSTVGGSARQGIESHKIDSEHVYVSYISLLEIKKQSEAEDNKLCSSIKASLKFEVVDGACELTKFEVLKCGFSIVYEADGTDHDKVSWEMYSDNETDETDHDDSTNGDDDEESMSSATQEPDEISDDEDGQQEEEISCLPFEDNGNVNPETTSDSDQNIDDEAIQRLSLVAALTEIKPECNSGADEGFHNEAKPEATPSLQKPHVTPGRINDESNQGINGEGDTTCFSFIMSFIPCLRRKQTT